MWMVFVRAAKVVAGPAIRLNDAAKILVVVSGAPRTKKNHGILTTAGGRPRMFPSKPWTTWAKEALVFINDHPLVNIPNVGPMLRTPSRTRPWQPLERLLNCTAIFYRQTFGGDAVGFYQGLADLLEHRGVVLNDSQIVSWDGSRLLKDAQNPRTEIVLTEAV